MDDSRICISDGKRDDFATGRQTKGIASDNMVEWTSQSYEKALGETSGKHKQEGWGRLAGRFTNIHVRLPILCRSLCHRPGVRAAAWVHAFCPGDACSRNLLQLNHELWGLDWCTGIDSLELAIGV